MDVAIAYGGKSVKLKTPKTTTIKVGSTVPVCGARFGRRRKNDEDCMYRSTFGRMERHNFAATLSKKNRKKSPLSSVGLLIIVRKNQCQSFFQLYLVNCVL